MIGVSLSYPTITITCVQIGDIFDCEFISFSANKSLGWTLDSMRRMHSSAAALCWWTTVCKLNIYTVCIRFVLGRIETMLPPGEWIWVHTLFASLLPGRIRTKWSHVQNRKYITCRTAGREGRNHGCRKCAQKMTKFSLVILAAK